MKDVISRCGYRCNLCLAYKENIHSKEDQKKISDGYFKYFGFRVPPDEIYCDGCLTPDDKNPRRIDTGCPVRPCVLEKQLENCAYCDQYITCSKLKTRADFLRSGLKMRVEDIPKEDYEKIIKPYEGRRVLEDVRKKYMKEKKKCKSTSL